jgi:hypothetical protein
VSRERSRSRQQRESETDLSDVHLAHLVPSVDALGQRLAASDGSEETTGKGVSGSVGIDDVLVLELVDGEGLGVLLSGLKVRDGRGRRGGGDDGRGGSLGDDDESRSRSVLLGRGGDGLGDGGRVVGLLREHEGRSSVSL